MSEGKQQKLGKSSKAQLNNEENNPCYKEHKLSLECMTRNNYDNEKCAYHFENYNTCKSFWNAVSKKRRNNGIKPHLPPLEERKIIRENYLKNGTL